MLSEECRRLNAGPPALAGGGQRPGKEPPPGAGRGAVHLAFSLFHSAFPFLFLLSSAAPAQDELLEGILRRAQPARATAVAGVEPGQWHCIGPFRNDWWDNELGGLAFVFDVEKQALAAGGRPDLSASHDAGDMPGVVDRTRRWQAHGEWIDPYYHELPRGPKPSWNETMYLYREVRAARPIEPAYTLISKRAVLSHSKPAGARVKAWLNGQPCAGRLRLREGVNHLLVKLTNASHQYGFAFGIVGLHPPAPPSGQDLRERPYHRLFRLGDRPMYVAALSGGDGSAAPPARRLKQADADLPEAVRADLAGRVDRDELLARIARYQDALSRLRELKFRPAPTPYYDAAVLDDRSRPTLPMEQALANVPPTPGARRYLDVLAELGRKVEPVLAAVDAGQPRVADVLRLEGELEAMWREEVRRLPPIVFVRRPPYSLNATTPTAHVGSAPSSLCIWDPSAPHAPPRVIFHQPDMAIHDLDLSWDGRTVFFSGKVGRGVWQIHEVGIDGRGLRKISRDEKVNDVGPAELPSGRIVFVSARADGITVCQGSQRPLLYTCNRDGSDVRLHSANMDADNVPKVMNDGRVLFTRWDYGVDKDVWIRHGLWTMNPDGTRLGLLFGNTIWDPCGWWSARAIPGRPEVVCVFGNHHLENSGMVGLVWPGFGTEPQRGEGYRWITTEMLSVYDSAPWWAWQCPYPLNEQQFLASYGGESHQLSTAPPKGPSHSATDGGQKVKLYLLDRNGNHKCLLEPADGLGVFFAQRLAARPRPPVVPEQSATPAFVRQPLDEQARTDPNWSQSATMLVRDVYEGISPSVRRGQAKYLAVLEQLPHWAGQRGWAFNYGACVGRGTAHVKRLIGLVPVEADGSAHFEVPALRSIYFCVLDADGRTLMKMGADMHAQPGERASCIGCHEYRRGANAPAAGAPVPLAAARPAVRPRMPDWGTNGIVEYQRVVQPVWDRYCVACHSGPAPEAHMDLSGDRTRYFCMSYDQLVDRGIVDFYEVDRKTDMDENAPLAKGSVVSRIDERLDRRHCGKTLSFEDRLRVYTWIDTNIPYYGTMRTAGRANGGRDAWFPKGPPEAPLDRRLAETPALKTIHDIYQARCADCHRRTVPNPYTHFTSGWGTVFTKIGTPRTGFGRETGAGPTLGIGGNRQINLSHPEHSPLLQAPLATRFGGWGLCKTAAGLPVLPDRRDADYRALLAAIQQMARALQANPRMDMLPLTRFLSPRAASQ